MIKIKQYREPVCRLYDSQNNYVGLITSVLSFYDVRAQIKEMGIKGYKIDFDGQMINIDEKGRLDTYPDGFYDDIEKLLDKLI